MTVSYGYTYTKKESSGKAGCKLNKNPPKNVTINYAKLVYKTLVIKKLNACPIDEFPEVRY